MTREAALPNTALAVGLLIAISAIVRMVVAAAVGLSVDESYIVGISRDWALSYFDHPPLHLWLVRAWATLAGSERPVVVRLPFMALFAGSTWVMYRLTARAYGERAGLWAAVTFNLTPVYTISIASWVLPDGPLMLFSLLAVYAVAYAVRDPGASESLLAGWFAAGIAAGLALLSKYTGIFVLFGVALFLATARSYRRLWLTPGPWLAGITSAVVFAPVVIWNSRHHWASFAFQGGRVTSHGFRVVWPIQDVGGQLAYLTPWIALPLLMQLIRALRRGPVDSSAWLLACLAVGPVALFTLLGLRTPILAHWPMIGWLFVFPLLGAALARLEASRPVTAHVYCWASAGLLIAVLGVAVTQARTGWITRLEPAWLAMDPTVDVLDWDPLEPALSRRGLLHAGTVLATPSWIDSGKVNYAFGGRYSVLCLCADPRAFAYAGQRPQTASDVLLISNATRADWQESLARYVDRIDPLADVVVSRNGQPAVTLHVARGIGVKAQSNADAATNSNR